MEESWDAENFEPVLPTTLTTSNKWDGEDEDEVKESWEDEEEEKKDEEKKDLVPIVKPKKKLIDKIAERERLAREELEKKQAEKEAEMTPEERLAEKLRRQKLQEESDLIVAMETFGVTEGMVAGRLDSFHPSTKAEFDEFADMLSKKIGLYKSKEEFPGFVEDLFKNITVQMTSTEIKKVKMTIDNIYVEKQKFEKSDKSKKPVKGKGKAKLRIEGDNAHLNQYDAYGNYDDEYNDFM